VGKGTFLEGKRWEKNALMKYKTLSTSGIPRPNPMYFLASIPPIPNLSPKKNNTQPKSSLTND
jgi:hypothetical protein